MSTPFEDQRARVRRMRRIGGAVAVVLLVIVGVVAVRHGSQDDARVVTVPGVPAVHLPQLGLAPADGTNRIGGWSPGRSAVVIRSPAPHVIAELEILRPDGADIPFSLPATMAGSLVALDDATWWGLLNPFGTPRDGVLALVGSGGHSEISSYQAADASGGGGSNVQVLDVPGYAPGTFELTTHFFVPTPGPAGPTKESGTVPGTTPDTEGADSIEVRGTRAEVLALPPDLEVPDGFQSWVAWNQNGVPYRLSFDHTISPQDAARVAERLSAPTEDEWHAMLFPSTLRIDLVPMPNPQPSDGTDTTGG